MGNAMYCYNKTMIRDGKRGDIMLFMPSLSELIHMQRKNLKDDDWGNLALQRPMYYFLLLFYYRQTSAKPDAKAAGDVP